ncbi:MAG: hypothetical protein HHAS10_12020 [Candidatus Altimarinota bacterium]
MNKKRNWDLLKPLWLGLVFGIIGLMSSLQQGNPSSETILAVYGFTGIPLGWSFINQHKPQTIGLVGTWWFWLFWNFLKLCLSMLIGSLLIPYQLYKFYKS